MTKLEKLRNYIASVYLQDKSKEERSAFFKRTAKKFDVSWQTVVGVVTAKEKYNVKVHSNENAFSLIQSAYPNQEVKKLKSKPFAPEPYLNGNPNNVIVIGDTHEPFCKEGYLEFVRKTQEKYDCGTVVHIGDLVDNHCVSYHEHDPNGKSIGDEFQDALINCKKWYYTFPNVKICIGNHDRLPFRKAFTAGLPANWLKTYQELFESPKTWEWDFVHTHNGVIYQHGTGMSGEMAAVNAARENRQSTVIGHLHTVCNTRFLASQKDLIFGVTVGCGIDHSAYAFAYGREQTKKPVIACTVILDGKVPINIPMTL